MTPSNLYLRSNGQRQCKRCTEERNAEREKIRKAEVQRKRAARIAAGIKLKRAASVSVAKRRVLAKTINSVGVKE